MESASTRILTSNGGSPGIWCALCEAAFSKNERYKTEDEVDGGSMKRAVRISTMLFDMDGMQLRSVSGMAGPDPLRKRGRTGA